jgi:hypothetical protein
MKNIVVDQEVEMARVALQIGTPITDILLLDGEIWRAEGDLRGEAIQCTKGTLWITQQGDLNDYFLRSGDRFWVTRPGRVLVQSIRNARFTCTRGEPPKQAPVYAHLGYE